MGVVGETSSGLGGLLLSCWRLELRATRPGLWNGCWKRSPV